jgi:hypothetical protein
VRSTDTLLWLSLRLPTPQHGWRGKAGWVLVGTGVLPLQSLISSSDEHGPVSSNDVPSSPPSPKSKDSAQINTSSPSESVLTLAALEQMPAKLERLHKIAAWGATALADVADASIFPQREAGGNANIGQTSFDALNIVVEDVSTLPAVRC